ncbi:helix-turn-helix domain-containing protein [Segatella copri]|uniref:Helix-turn-helix transcriptional regulator n=1 Tax=Segatella copri TaxID=165179 RepID=A0AA90V3M9_9BACT|nr:AraC family transcriptional regulator [Segatella copri]MQN85347.1 helix-turn-helix transcriptional regulator [Segatella copri]
MRSYKPYIIKLCIVFLCFWGWILTGSAQKVGTNDYFYVLNTQQGLSDNCILQMIQLADGRLAVRTRKGINLYNGRRFTFIPLPAEKAESITKYKGQTHLYADSQDRLWVKEYQKIFCIQLAEGRLQEHPLDSLPGNGKENKMRIIPNTPTGNAIQDLFVDSRKNVWVVMGDSLLNTQDGNLIHLKKEWGYLQDLDTDGKQVYAFMDSGIVAVFQKDKLVYAASAYSTAEAQHYRNTSLTIQTLSGQFYQIRTGRGEKNKADASIFLHFNPETRKFARIFACNYILHTLNMSSDNQALISSQHGYLMFDFKLGTTPREVRELSLPDGKSLTTGINTVYRDKEGAIWLGTYHDGLIYVSPMLGLFFTIDQPWWQSGWAIAGFVVFLATLVGIITLYLRRRKRINVINTDSIKDEVPLLPADSQQQETAETLNQEPELILQVRALVEQHLEDGEYGVEQLARDLCMERTGLYKKLTALIDTTPVAFIRSIRLHRAAALLQEGKLSVNEIADRTGFSSPSYFTKCFKKEFGVLPSEYR